MSRLLLEHHDQAVLAVRRSDRDGRNCVQGAGGLQPLSDYEDVSMDFRNVLSKDKACSDGCNDSQESLEHSLNH
jgi:hypothetical protein